MLSACELLIWAWPCHGSRVSDPWEWQGLQSQGCGNYCLVFVNTDGDSVCIKCQHSFFLSEGFSPMLHSHKDSLLRRANLFPDCWEITCCWCIFTKAYTTTDPRFFVSLSVHSSFPATLVRSIPKLCRLPHSAICFLFFEEEMINTMLLVKVYGKDGTTMEIRM